MKTNDYINFLTGLVIGVAWVVNLANLALFGVTGPIGISLCVVIVATLLFFWTLSNKR